MKNSFGNYVAQKALALAEGEVKDEFGMAIQENLQHLTEKKLRTKWTQILDQCSGLYPSNPEDSKKSPLS